MGDKGLIRVAFISGIAVAVGIIQCDLLHFFTFLLECIQKSDCPNEGLNYKCNMNVCECESGFVLNGDACIVPGKYLVILLDRERNS